MDPKLTPQRKQYAFDLSGVRYKTRSDILKMQQQWNIFEQVENYNDVIFQRFELGLWDKPWYQFRDREEANNYKNGQELHILRYAYLPTGTFASISGRLMPDVEVKRSPSNYSQVSRDVITTAAMPASLATEQRTDLQIYSFVSTYNTDHYYKYNFVSDEERLAYHRAELLLRMSSLRR